MSGPDVSAFNLLSADEAQGLLRTCLDVPRWVAEVEGGRPYAGWAALREAAEQSAARLTEAELEAALTRHPRIGERAGADHDAEHSEREQAGVDPADRDAASRLAAGNAAYENRFDRVFLIRAAGRSADEILGELERRLDNDDGTERDETVRQLSEIAVLRLEGTV
ncbi:2-oxo-4-hydroxy-4-carboxy-5-ureidoimidazoline decarboxylase [Lapillicoccus sp.]|uniref:2-oxo-4-hydroxy-4-carboxy-5-ureidoimidazoline decarboxylase n=1 Tax=Lapillicoccus sp. TaxID=1909287 RepID=UPI002F946ADF